MAAPTVTPVPRRFVGTGPDLSSARALIDVALDLTTSRTMFTADEVQDMLLDVLNAIAGDRKDGET